MVNRFLPSLFDRLSQTDIDYCIWGNYLNLPFSIGDSDLDIVVSNDDATKLFHALDEVASEYGGKVVSFFKMPQSHHYRILGLFGNESWGIMIDVIWDDFRYEGRTYIAKSWIDYFKRDYRGLTVNELGFSYLAGLIKELIHNGHVKQKYIDGTSKIMQERPHMYRDFILSTYGLNAYKILITISSAGFDKSKMNDLRKVLLSSLKGRRTDYVRNLYWRWRRLFTVAPGYTIAFIGVDGAGKSTLIKEITPVLSECFNKNIRYEHMRPNFIPSINKLLNPSKAANFGPVVNPHTMDPSGYLISFLRLSYYLFDYYVGYYVKIWPSRKTRSVFWMFDRYYYDYLLDPRRTRVDLPKALLYTMFYILPKPDLVFCLGTNPSLIFERKPEVSLSEIKRQVTEMKVLVEKNNNFYWIDTGVTVEQSVNLIILTIRNRMSERYGNEFPL